MNRKLVAGVLINEKGVLMSGHLPYCIIKHENKEFWFEVEICSKNLQNKSEKI